MNHLPPPVNAVPLVIRVDRIDSLLGALRVVPELLSLVQGISHEVKEICYPTIFVTVRGLKTLPPKMIYQMMGLEDKAHEHSL